MGGVYQGEFYRLFNREEKLRRSLQEDPVVSLADDLLYKALEVRASDIHVQPEYGQARIRYRIDGVLHDFFCITNNERLALVSRLKLLAHLDIAECRVPQDGKLKLLVAQSIQGKEKAIDCRVATFPSVYGEKLVIRILDQEAQLLDLFSLGLTSQYIEQIKSLLHLPYGFFLTTGPTGSGKTTTLYAMLTQLNTRQKNVVTMEDPVEYDIHGITQSQVNRKAGFTFENGLRSLLRQDPDVIMIGEIRDTSTIQIAVEAALTGHLVLSTLHTNSAVGALARIMDMGIEPFVVTASVTAVLAQRLVRRLCDVCKQMVTLTDENKQMFAHLADISVIFKPQGCAACDHVGYRGRVGLFELLIVDDTIRSLILKKSPVDALYKAAIAQGMVPLLNDGLIKAQQGIISYEELLATVRIL